MLSRISGRSVLASFCAFLFQRNWGPQAAQRLGRQLADSGPVGRRSGVCIASLQILAPQAAGPRYVLPAPVLGITQILAHKAKFTRQCNPTRQSASQRRDSEFRGAGSTPTGVP